MNHAEFSRQLLQALTESPSKVPPLVTDASRRGNAGRCMMKLLCNRLTRIEESPRRIRQAYFSWREGVIAVRNSRVQNDFWTSLVPSVEEDVRAFGELQPASYLFIYWSVDDGILHAWAIPEDVGRIAFAKLKVDVVTGRKTVLISLEDHQLKNAPGAPNFAEFYLRAKLTVAEKANLLEAIRTDDTVKQDRLDESEAETSTDEEQLDEELPGPLDAPHALSPERPVRYWAISLGEGGRLWNKCQEEGVAAICWDELGDLRQFGSLEAITQTLRAQRGVDAPAPTNNAKACYDFAFEMQRGDFVIAKIGRNRLLGAGIVQSDYRYYPTRPEYHNVRDVKWIRAQNLELPENAWVPMKTLTEVTEYRAFTEFVRANLLDLESASVPELPKKQIAAAPPFTVEDALADLFLARSQLEAILSALRRKRNVVLQGPPGVGKTFLARRIAYALMGQKDKNRYEMVQFHQSYSYEDFIQCYRPRANGGFQRRDGVFYDFCNRARLDRERPFVFVIDEINRGKLSKIFGELMMLIEGDKRGPDFAVPLTYSESSGERFSVPDNVYLIGLMNTADRSLAMVDYALRRRFVFFNLEPCFKNSPFATTLQQQGVSASVVSRIIEKMSELNDVICSDHKNLGRGFAIGHSFFCPNLASVSDDIQADDWDRWYRTIVETEIAPLLEEYWFDDPERAQSEIEKLLSP